MQREHTAAIATPGPNPIVRFAEWLTHALGHLPMANAMSLATATPTGVTSLRTVLLKAYSESGFIFFTSPETLKVRQMAENPHVSLLFFWPALNRQIRIDGMVSRIPVSALARRLLAMGPRDDAVTWVSSQGRVADARQAIEAKWDEVRRIVAGDRTRDGGAGSSPVCSFIVSPVTIELWQGGSGRQHASLEYRRTGNGWTERSSGSLAVESLAHPPQGGLA